MVAATRPRRMRKDCGTCGSTLRDFVADGSGLPAASVDYVMLFNILHAEHPEVLMRRSSPDPSAPAGSGIIHWRYDAATPRGPSMDIRPRPEQCRRIGLSAALSITSTLEKPNTSIVVNADPPFGQGKATISKDGGGTSR